MGTVTGSPGLNQLVEVEIVVEEKVVLQKLRKILWIFSCDQGRAKMEKLEMN